MSIRKRPPAVVVVFTLLGLLGIINAVRQAIVGTGDSTLSLVLFSFAEGLLALFAGWGLWRKTALARPALWTWALVTAAWGVAGTWMVMKAFLSAAEMAPGMIAVIVGVGVVTYAGNRHLAHMQKG